MSERQMFFITVAFGALGWIFTHFVQVLSTAPIIEYSYEQKIDGDQIFELHLQNITGDKNFKNVEASFYLKPGNRIKSIEVVPIEPAHEGDTQPESHENAGRILLSDFMPGTDQLIIVRHTSRERPMMRLRADGGAVRFQKSGLETFFIQNDSIILLLLGLGWIGLSVFIVFRPRTQNATVQPSLSSSVANQTEIGHA